MIFLVGAKRSGTNLLGRMIAAHPDVGAVRSESCFFSHGIAPLLDRFQHAALGSWSIGVLYMERPELIAAVRRFCDDVFGAVLRAEPGGPSVLLERSPEHSNHVALIREIYPDAHIVHIIRDGRDVVRSLASMTWSNASITEAARTWHDAVELARAGAAGTPRYHEVRYEDLVADPVGVVARLYAALDLQVDGDVLEAAQIEAEIVYNADPAMRGIATGQWAETWSPEDLACFTAVAGPLLAELGYERQRPDSLTVTEPSAAAVAPAPARSGAARARSLARTVLRRTLRRRTDLSSGAAADLTEMSWQQHRADALLGHIRAGRLEDAIALFSERPLITVVTPSDQWTSRVSGSVERFVHALADDPAFRGRQLLCDVYPALAVFTIVLVAEHEGVTYHRTLVLAFEGRAEDQRVHRAAFYAAE